MRAGSREHGSHVAMLTTRIPLHLGRPSRVQRYSSSMHRAMEEDSLMTRYDDDLYLMDRFSAIFILLQILYFAKKIIFVIYNYFFTQF